MIRTFDNGAVVGERPDAAAEEAGVRVANAYTLRGMALDALAINRQLGTQNDAIITQAQVIEGFSGLVLTQAQTISALKQLATGVRLLAEHDQQALRQLNVLMRLVVGALEGTD